MISISPPTHTHTTTTTPHTHTSSPFEKVRVLLQGGCSRGRGCTLHDKRRQQADVPQASGAKLRSQQIASRQPHVLLRRRGAFYEDGGARQLAALRFDHSRPTSKVSAAAPLRLLSKSQRRGCTDSDEIGSRANGSLMRASTSANCSASRCSYWMGLGQ